MLTAHKVFVGHACNEVDSHLRRCRVLFVDISLVVDEVLSESSLQEVGGASLAVKRAARLQAITVYKKSIKDQLNAYKGDRAKKLASKNPLGGVPTKPELKTGAQKSDNPTFNRTPARVAV